MTFEQTLELFQHSFDRGGFVMWPILGVSLVVWYVGFGRLVALVHIRRARRRFLKQVELFAAGEEAGRGPGPFCPLAAALPDIRRGRRSLAYAYRELLLTLVPELDRGFPTMTAWIAAAPLLGLLGTVVGMVETFEIINLFGIGNPHLMAQGISVALLTTQAGLIVAFPALIFQLLLQNQKKKLVERLVGDEQSIARTLNEAARHG